MANATLGVFCIENWASDLRAPSTVRPLLDYLRWADGPRIRFVHQRVSTLDELHTYFDRWVALDGYEVMFLALHGYPGGVSVGSDSMTVNQLLDRTWENEEDEWVVDLSGKVLYFGACSTLQREKGFERAVKATHARVVCGYTKTVWQWEAAAFEVILFSEFGRHDNPVEALRRIEKRFPDLVDRLGFRWRGLRARSAAFQR